MSFLFQQILVASLAQAAVLALNQLGASGFTPEHVTLPGPASAQVRLKAQLQTGGQPGQHVPKVECVLGRAGPAAVQLRAGAAGRDVVPEGEPVAGAQGAGRTVALPRRFLRQPAAGLRAAMVPTAATGGARPELGDWKLPETRGWEEGCL